MIERLLTGSVGVWLLLAAIDLEVQFVRFGALAEGFAQCVAVVLAVWCLVFAIKGDD